MTKKRGRIIATGIMVAACIVFPPLVFLACMIGVIICGVTFMLCLVAFVTMFFEGLWAGEIDSECKEAGQGMLLCGLGLIVSALMMWATSPLVDMWANWLERLA